MITFLVFLISSCKNDRDVNKPVMAQRECDCPMPVLYDKDIQKDSVLTGMTEDVYDWNIGGLISAKIRKIIHLEIETSNRSGESKFQISASSVLRELRSDYPELIDKSFAVKLKRVSFCTYHDIICRDTTIADSTYRQLTLLKLEDFDESIKGLLAEKDKNNKLKGQEKSSSNNVEPIIDSRIINSTIYTENQSGGSNTVNVTNVRTSASYIEPSIYILNKVQSQLQEIRNKHKIPNITWIIINIEAGSSLRYKVANDLESILSSKGKNWASFGRTNTMMGRFPDFPVSIIFNPELETVVSELKKTLELYIIDGIILRPDAVYRKGAIEIYINGTPVFDSDGRVKVE
jgi:hypothetical protein